MAQDQTTFQRATMAAIVGFVIQFVLALLMGLIGLWTDSPAVKAATWHFLGGLPIWIILILVYHQHKLERIESLEAENLARQDRQAAAIFDEHADDLDLARRRLNNLYKFGLNIVSGLIGLYLLGMGGFLFYVLRQEQMAIVPRPPIAADVNPMLLMALTGAMAFFAFAAGRYLSGMTRVREWQLLRGGASYLMSTFLLALFIFGGAVFYQVSGQPDAFVYLQSIIPGVMVLVGVEVLLTFLLSAYRPRRPGEIPRPAFDSRVLGLLTSPDSLSRIVTETLNYQFGVDVSSSWFFELVRKYLPYLVPTAAAILLLLSSIVMVEPHEQAIILRHGELNRIVSSGISFKRPYPFESFQKFEVERVEQIDVGSDIVSPDGEDAPEAILWTTEMRGRNDRFFVTAPTPLTGDLRDELNDEVPDDLGVDAGTGLAGCHLVVQYRIDDLATYAGNGYNRRLMREMMSALAERALSNYFAANDIDTLLTQGRLDAGRHISAELQQEANDLRLGIRVVHAALSGIHPPQDTVAPAFHEVIGASQEKLTLIEEAAKDAISIRAQVAGSVALSNEIDQAIVNLNRLKNLQREGATVDGMTQEMLDAQVAEQEVAIEVLLDRAKGQAAERIYEARAYRWTRSITERASAARFEAELVGFLESPRYYKARRYLDTLATAMADRRKYVIASDALDVSVFSLELKEEPDAIQTLFGDAPSR